MYTQTHTHIQSFADSHSPPHLHNEEKSPAPGIPGNPGGGGGAPGTPGGGGGGGALGTPAKGGGGGAAGTFGGVGETPRLEDESLLDRGEVVSESSG